MPLIRLQFILRYCSSILIPWGGYYALASTGIDRIVTRSLEVELCRWERALLGGASAPEHCAAWMKYMPFNYLMVSVYISFYAVLLMTPAWLIWNKRWETFIKLRLQWALVGLCGYVMYFLVPAKSPYYVLALYEQQEFSLSQSLVHRALEGGVAFPHDAFPSMHVAFSTIAVCVTGSTVSQSVRAWMWVWLLLLLLSVIATGAHWGLDIMAGLVLSGFVCWLYTSIISKTASIPECGRELV